MSEKMRYYPAGVIQGVGGTLLAVWLSANWRGLSATEAGPSGLLLPSGSILFILGSLLARKRPRAFPERPEREQSV